MSSWSILLEALHSATIDALNSALPETQLMLGLPKKTASATPPDPTCAERWQTFVEVPELGAATVLLAASPELQGDHGLKLPELWGKILKEATTTSFAQKGLNPTFSDKPGAAPQQVIWIPIGVKRARLLLGLGI